jgi:hypothetical protein
MRLVMARGAGQIGTAKPEKGAKNRSEAALM